MNEDPTWACVSPRLRPKPPIKPKSARVQKIKTIDPSILRAYNRLIKNNKEIITAENQIYHEPEFLIQEKNTTLTEINKLKTEIQPLVSQLSNLQSYIEENYPEIYSGEQYEDQFVASLAEEQKECNRLDSELAKRRRDISEATQLKLTIEIDNYRRQISDISSSLSSIQRKLRKRENALQRINDSPLTATMREQQEAIYDLSAELSQLLDEERMLQTSAAELLAASTPTGDGGSESEQARRRLEQVRYQKMKRSQEHRRKAAEYDAAIADLRQQIEAKRAAKQKRLGRDAWRKNLGISKDVLDEIDTRREERSQLPMLNM